ncbi:hypothetical protein SADUNF_Sadunf15G0086700 [Salix dunnii]|uniref:FIST C-domain domain-containing protein n=1 Tax=Salix dunnii TaxID=1413687 RepID=A0A835MIS2_9ROSI|nr:hypothetical protein SADUNF_Sadunf15G0086700 [Salix dunnii]
MAKQLPGRRTYRFLLVTEEIMQNILSRLPVLAFANAACVNKCWYKIGSQILKRPKLASALSLNPSLHVCCFCSNISNPVVKLKTNRAHQFLCNDYKDAVEEVTEQVLSEPIRPHFAIACISKEFDLDLTHGLIIKKLGSSILIITNIASGIIGVDGIADELHEEKWETTTVGPNSQELDTIDRGLVLLFGFLPGLKISTIPLLRPMLESNKLVDKFVMDILHYTSVVSDCQAPTAIIIFGDKTTDMKLVVSKMDCVMPEETIIVGIREIQFHVTMSKGLMPFGPKLEPCKTRRIEWVAVEILNDLKQQFRDADMSADIYISVTKETMRTNDSGILIPGRCLDFYRVKGGGGRYFNVHGVDIQPGDSFLFYHSDSETASSTCVHAFNKLLTLKAELKSKNYLHLSKFADKDDKKEVPGGLIFSCDRRGESFFGEPFVDSSPFFDSFPTAPVAGLLCRGEIGRGPKSLMNEENKDEKTPNCCLHVYSTIYLVMSYLPPPTCFLY